MNTTTALPPGENSEEMPRTMERVMSSKSCLKKLDGGSSSDLSLSRLPKRVSFDKIEILQFPIEVGDNPCAQGVPISIGWEADETDVFDLDLYEQHKPERRGRAGIHIPARIRQDLLAAEGTTLREMLEAVKEAQKIHKSRLKSIRSQKWDGVHYAMEMTSRKIRKVASLSSKSRVKSISSQGQKWDGINYAMEMTSRRIRKAASLSSLSSSPTATSSSLPHRGSLQRMPVVLPESSDFVAEVPAAVEEVTAGEVDDGPLCF
jgi:hypothetical protein